MNDEGRIGLLRQTLLAVIDLLGPKDRLSIFKFSDKVTRITPLSVMAESGRTAARRAVAALAAGGGTNIDGLIIRNHFRQQRLNRRHCQ